MKGSQDKMKPIAKPRPLTAESRLAAPEQMALDEALLRASPPDLTVVRFYHWAGQAVTFGYGQPWALAEGAARVRGMGNVPVVRRPTGGGVVFHDGDFTFSVVFPWPGLGRALGVYEALHKGIREALLTRGVETFVFDGSRPHSLRASPVGRGLRQGGSSHVCFTAPSRFDLLTLGGRKILGGALRRRHGRGLYQGSLRPEACGLSGTVLREAVALGTRAAWPGPWTDRPDPAWYDDARRLAEKYRSPAWNKRR